MKNRPFYLNNLTLDLIFAKERKIIFVEIPFSVTREYEISIYSADIRTSNEPKSADYKRWKLEERSVGDIVRG